MRCDDLMMRPKQQPNTERSFFVDEVSRRLLAGFGNPPVLVGLSPLECGRFCCGCKTHH